MKVLNKAYIIGELEGILDEVEKTDFDTRKEELPKIKSRIEDLLIDLYKLDKIDPCPKFVLESINEALQQALKIIEKEMLK